MRPGLGVDRDDVGAGGGEKRDEWTSKGKGECGLSAPTTPGPIVMLGTKCPSMTSIWIRSAPASVTARNSAPSLAKSAERMDGAILTARGTRCW